MSSHIATDRWTYSRYLTLDDEHRYEVLEGKLIMVPAPDVTHQKISKYLGILLFKRVESTGRGEIYYAPTDVVLSEDTVCQPDLLVILSSNQEIIKEKAIMGAPDIIVEIVSPTSVYTDTQRKVSLYEKYGIKEYWLVYPQEKVIDIYTFEKGGYRISSHAENKGMIHSSLLNEDFPLEQIFHFNPVS